VNNNVKTAAFVGCAALLWLLATMTGPRAVENELFLDEGELFFPQFTDPEAATGLEVWSFDETGSTPVAFAVKRDDKGRWTIPSHYDYPADAKTRMAKSAVMMIGLKKDRVASDRKDDHVGFGVVDPMEENLELKGRGTRVAFKDKASGVLGELIIGKEVEGKTDMHYVRQPGKNRVYAARFDNQLSTKFADWIETDLLKAQSWDIAAVTFDNYSVDEQQGAIVKGDRIVVKKDDASKWTIEGLGEDEEPNEDKLREIGDTLGQIKIVGVRRKPEGLTEALQQAQGFDRAVLQQLLQEKGYFLARDGRLVSNEGDLLFETKKGIRYTLRFGEIVYGEGDVVTAGAEPKAPKPPTDGQQNPPPPPAGNNRYLMVSAAFDEALLKKPTGLRLPQEVLDKRKQAADAIESIVRGIDAYKQKHDGKLPETLAQLLEKPNETDAAPLEKLDKDPWGQDYSYIVQADTFTVSSFAQDQKEGGEGPDLDVRSDQLPKEQELRRQADEWTEYDRKVQDGKKEGESLQKRFGPWYYVIASDLFSKLKPARSDLVKPKEKPPETPPTPGGTAPGEPGK
jgi:hypothetical protein